MCLHNTMCLHNNVPTYFKKQVKNLSLQFASYTHNITMCLHNNVPTFFNKQVKELRELY